MVLPGLQLGFFETAKTTILNGFAALPYLLVIFSGFFGGITGNLGLVILFLGQIFLVPTLQLLISLIRNTQFFSEKFRVGSVKPLEPYCSLVPDVTRKGSFNTPAISNWLAQVSFFFGFLLFNGYTVYTLPPAEGAKADDIKLENRKAHAIWSLILSFLVFVGIIAFYYNVTKCESPGSLIVGLILFLGLGVGWFQFAKDCGIKQTDIFGIVTKIHTIKPGKDEYPSVCVPLKNNTCNPECNRSTGKMKDCPCSVASECNSNTCSGGKCT